MYMSCTEAVLVGLFVCVCREQLLCQCILFNLHLFGTLHIYSTMNEVYFENSDVSLVDGNTTVKYTDILHKDRL